MSWSHTSNFLKIDDPLERSFYEQQAIRERWSVRELQRQKKSSLFLRLAAGKDKDAILRLASQGQIIEQPSDLLRDPFVFEFLKIPEPHSLSETDLKGRLCDHLQPFLLELGKGFTFVGRQYRITLNNTHYHVDLVFYHRILRCFVLIDLKLDDVQHYDIGQMNLYLGYFAAEENVEGDNPPIGIILTRHKDELLVEYATYGMNSQLFVQKYQLYLPEREELRREIERTLRISEEEGRERQGASRRSDRDPSAASPAATPCRSRRPAHELSEIPEVQVQRRRMAGRRAGALGVTALKHRGRLNHGTGPHETPEFNDEEPFVSPKRAPDDCLAKSTASYHGGRRCDIRPRIPRS